MLFLFLLSICYVTTNSSRKTSQSVPSGGDERVQGSSYSINEASLTGLQLTSCCGGLVPNRPRTATSPDYCAGIVDSCSKPNSGTFCKTNHPASAQFLNKQMALKLGEEQLFCLKREKPSASYEYILSINCEKTSAF